MSVEVHSTMLVDMHVLISRQYPLLSQINHEESALSVALYFAFSRRLPRSPARADPKMELVSSASPTEVHDTCQFNAVNGKLI